MMHKSEYKAKKELDEARKTGVLPPEQDKEGNLINPHIPAFMANAPWYLNQSGPGLQHQRKSEAAKSEFGFSTYYKRGEFAGQATSYRKGACKNCGSMTHTEKTCIERPRKVGAWKTNKDIRPDEVIHTDLQLDFDTKRDRYNGYDPSQHLKGMQKFAEAEEERKRLRQEQKAKEQEEKQKKKEARRAEKKAEKRAKKQAEKEEARRKRKEEEAAAGGAGGGAAEGKADGEAAAAGYHSDGGSTASRASGYNSDDAAAGAADKKKSSRSAARKDAEAAEGSSAAATSGAAPPSSSAQASDDDSDSDATGSDTASDYSSLSDDSDSDSDGDVDEELKDSGSNTGVGQGADGSKAGGKGKGSKSKMSIRNLRVMEDRAKYLINLDTESAYFDPKTRSMRENPNPEGAGEGQGGAGGGGGAASTHTTGSNYRGDLAWRRSGDFLDYAKAELFAWEAAEKTGDAVAIHLQANPTQLELLQKQFTERKAKLAEEKRKALLEKYGGEELLQESASMPKELLRGASEGYTEYTRDGRIIKQSHTSSSSSSSSSAQMQQQGEGGSAAGSASAVGRSRYKEDVHPGNHSSVWGSWYDKETGLWGFACCHNTFRNSYCTGRAGIEAEESSRKFAADALAAARSSGGAGGGGGAGTGGSMGRTIVVSDSYDPVAAAAALREKHAAAAAGAMGAPSSSSSSSGGSASESLGGHKRGRRGMEDAEEEGLPGSSYGSSSSSSSSSSRGGMAVEGSAQYEREREQARLKKLRAEDPMAFAAAAGGAAVDEDGLLVHDGQGDSLSSRGKAGGVRKALGAAAAQGAGSYEAALRAEQQELDALAEAEEQQDRQGAAGEGSSSETSGGAAILQRGSGRLSGKATGGSSSKKTGGGGGLGDY